MFDFAMISRSKLLKFNVPLYKWFAFELLLKNQMFYDDSNKYSWLRLVGFAIGESLIEK
jgi:hypothetical protein